MKIERIVKWGAERGLNTYQHDENAFLRMIIEEISEYLQAESDGYNKEEMVDALGDISVFGITELPKLGFNPSDIFMDYGRNISEFHKQFPEYFNDNLTTAENLVNILGKFIGKTKEEKAELIKEICILSWKRIQKLDYNVDCVMDEILKEIESRTGAYDEKQGKWIKDKSPEAQAKWYKADFSNCEV
jgi:hypothetical protein